MLSYMPLSALEPCGIEMSRPYIAKGYIVCSRGTLINNTKSVKVNQHNIEPSMYSFVHPNIFPIASTKLKSCVHLQLQYKLGWALQKLDGHT